MENKHHSKSKAPLILWNVPAFRLLIVLLLVWPTCALAEMVVRPVRYVEVVTSDNLGEDLSYPSALFYDSAEDEIYVTSPLRNRLILLTSDYFPYLSVGEGRGLNNVTSCFPHKGRLYVTVGPSKEDPRGHIEILDGAFLPDGKIYFSGFEGSDTFLPRKIVVGATGKIYVSDLNSTGVVVLDPAGSYLRAIEPKDEVLGVSEKASIISMDIGRDGRLYLLSEGMGRIYVYDRNEKFLYKFGQKGGDAGKLARPRGIAVDDDNNRIYIVDYQRHTTSAFNMNGSFLFEFGGMGRAHGWFFYPSDVCIDGFGRLVIADTFNHRVQVFELLEKEGHGVRLVDDGIVSLPLDGEEESKQASELSSEPPQGRQADGGKAEVAAEDAKPAEYVLQVAFSRQPAEAQKLLERLATKGYAVFIYETDKGDKGIWYSVLIGPFADSAAAKEEAKRLKAEENLSSIAKKR